MSRLIGLAGTHGCGKTTLAQQAAEQNGALFAPTSISAVLKSLDIDLKAPLPMLQRMNAQDEILKVLTSQWEAAVAHPDYQVAVTDRTPFDLIAYLMADVSAYQVLDAGMEARIERYVQDCIDTADRLFSQLIVIKGRLPAEVVNIDGTDKVRGLGVDAYRDKLELLIMGAIHRIDYPHMIMESADLGSRLASMRYVIRRALAA